MRKMIIMRGHQGSLKSTILEETGLSWHTVSVDQIRQTIGGIRMQPKGGWILNQEDNGHAWGLARESVLRRIQKGETLAIDACFPEAAETEEFADIGLEAGYEVLIVDRWSSDREQAFLRNQTRHPNTRVARQSFDKFCRLADTTRPLRPDLKVLATGDDVDASISGILEFLEHGHEIVDLSGYDRIVHVGDLQGCLAPLISMQSPVARLIDDPSTFFVFVGDLFDRGLQNGEVARWWLDNMVGRENMRAIAGNHETHVEREALGLDPVSKEFEKRTLPQLHAAGIDRADMARIAGSFTTHLAYLHHDRGVLVTHAGLSQWPDPIWAVPTGQMRTGVGTYTHPIDSVWSEWCATEHAIETARRMGVRSLWQVHGHRNQAGLPIVAAPGSINLEGQVEFGGHMRFATLDHEGWTPVAVRNNIHRTMQEFRMHDIEDGRQTYGHVAPLTPWAKRGVTRSVPMPARDVQSLRDSGLVSEMPSRVLPGVSSFNFSKVAFYKQAWNDVTVRARGLFLSIADDVVVARGWNKYFNRNQRMETSDEQLERNLKYPVVGYVKENGFLGVTGYDDRTGTLVIGTKSTLEGQFSDWFREILQDALGDVGMERLLRFNRDQIASCDFEVVDPVNDPHIIEEPRRRVVLLDAIRRDGVFEAMPYEDLLKLGRHLGCEVKKLAFKNIKDWRTLKRLLDEIENDESWRPNRTSGQVEGVVIVDAAGFMFKAKARFYALWKRARGAKERILLARRNGSKPFDAERYAGDTQLERFVEWCRRQSDATLALDIVSLRRMYEHDLLLESQGVLRPSEAPAPVPETKPDHAGLLRGVDAIVEQLDKGSAKRESVIRMIERCDSDVSRKKAFDAHPSSGRLRRFAGAEHDPGILDSALDQDLRP